MNDSRNNLQQLLADGFTERMANEYLESLEHERQSRLFDAEYLTWAHANGFLGESACAYQLSENNIDQYLSDYDFYKMYPHNDWQRIWINDKLTLNALLMDSEFEHYLPEYYYYSAKDRLLPLQYSNGQPSIDSFLKKLREKKAIACKPCNGAGAVGFHMLEYKEGTYFIDGQPGSSADTERLIRDCRNYVFTEFIYPSKQMAQINPRIHTLRILVINETGIDPVMVGSYLRFAVGGEEDGYKPNYFAPRTPDMFSYSTKVDLDTGRYHSGKKIFANRIEDAPCHPTSGTLVEGVIENWEEVVRLVRRISLKIGACEYLGFDIGITDNGPKLMEINSMSGIKYLQVNEPMLSNRFCATYFSRKLNYIDTLSEEERKNRNRIIR